MLEASTRLRVALQLEQLVEEAHSRQPGMKLAQATQSVPDCVYPVTQVHEVPLSCQKLVLLHEVQRVLLSQARQPGICEMQVAQVATPTSV